MGGPSCGIASARSSGCRRGTTKACAAHTAEGARRRWAERLEPTAIPRADQASLCALQGMGVLTPVGT